MGCDRQMDIAGVQTIRKIVLLFAFGLGIVIFSLTGSSYAGNSVARQAIEWFGVGLIAICILGRTWASLYIGGRKIVDLVTTGPYSITRNPLYFFSVIGAAGIGAQAGSITVALVCSCAGFLVFSVVARREEGLLLKQHRQSYVAYLKRVPRFFPNPFLWRDEPTLMVRPSRVYMTFADALLFMLAMPLAQACEYFQSTGILPVLVLLP
jgi:protein-S-isoprenylcysteine O-methyltransferase Ste14